jgi:hypothetical protein
MLSLRSDVISSTKILSLSEGPQASQARTSPPRDDVGTAVLYRAKRILEYIIGTESEALQPPLLAAQMADTIYLPECL